MRGADRPRAFGLRAGDRMGRYECIAPLAMGGMAEVYLARHRGAAGFEKRVVIKRVLPHLAIDRDFVDMFLKEAKLAAALEHPSIAAVIDFGHDGEDYFMVLEYVQGYDLRAVIKAGVGEHGGLPLDMAVGITIEAANALHHAHEQRDPQGKPLGIVHRDVSPSNILVAHTGAVKVIDFGIARAIGVSRTTRAGVVKGKAGYMSPEQCRDEALDRRTDVFGLGIVLYEMSTGYRLFHAQSDYAAMNKIAEGRFTPPSEAVPDYPPGLEAIVLRCLEVDRERRYPSCDALRDALEGFAVEQRLRLSAAARAKTLESWLGPVEEVGAAEPSAVAPTDPTDDPGASEDDKETAMLPLTSGTRETVALPATGGSATPAPSTSPMRSGALMAMTAAVTGLVVWWLSTSGGSEVPSSSSASSPSSAPAAEAEDPVPVAAPAGLGNPAKADTATNDVDAATPPIPSDSDPSSALQTPSEPAEPEPATKSEPAAKPSGSRRKKSGKGSGKTKSSGTTGSSERKTLLPPSMQDKDKKKGKTR